MISRILLSRYLIFVRRARHQAMVALLIIILLPLITPEVFADDYTSSSYTIRDPVMTIEGGRETSASFQYISATGQTVIGESTGTTFKTKLGFLYFSVTALSQDAYQWYSNTDALQPVSSLAALNTAVTSVAN